MTQPAPQPWTKDDLHREMRKVGYYRPDSAFAIYRHERTGYEINLDEFKNGSTVWKYYANKREVPMAKISFPEHMRRLEDAMNNLANECQKLNNHDEDFLLRVEVDAFGFFFMTALTRGGRKRSDAVTPEDAAIALLHKIAGTEEVPF